MTVYPREALVTALSGDPQPTRLELHAFLYRLCSAQIVSIRNCVREPAWTQVMAESEWQAIRLLEEADWQARLAARLRRWISKEDGDRLLILYAAVLRALDARHFQRRTEIAGLVIELPIALGDGKTLFLPPPETPLMDLIPGNQRLRRGPGDLKSDLREILGIQWRLVALENLPVAPRVQELDALVSRELSGRLATGDLRFGLASPFADLSYAIRSDPARCGADGIPYRFAGLEPGSLVAADQILHKTLNQCGERRVDVLCLPELTLDTDVQSRLILFLKTADLPHRPALVVAGSFHVDSEGHWVNQCRIFSGGGRLLFSQNKCVPFRIPAAQAADSPELCKLLGIDHRGGYEDIHLSTVLEILDGPLGRLATPICLDYCGDQLRDLLVATTVNLFLVPAMTLRMQPFHDRARDLGTQTGAVSLVTNSAWLLRQNDKQNPNDLALAYLPAYPVPVLTPSLDDPLWVFSIRELLGLT